MSRLFEELDYRETPIGPVSLRRRRVMALDVDVFEIILGDEHLMSSLFTASEIALADLGLAALDGDRLDVLVGGLGLGYTARAVLGVLAWDLGMQGAVDLPHVMNRGGATCSSVVLVWAIRHRPCCRMTGWPR